MRLASGAHARRRDRRPPIIYLRSFHNDDTTLKSGERIEEAITEPLQACGPFLAIGRPGELAPRGAARIFYSDADWQAAVISMLRASGFIVVVAGWTKGLQWEVETIKAEGQLEKSIWVLPPPGKHHDVICNWLSAGFRGTSYEGKL